jgi:ribosomal protein S18 acetylase RimI-like enzyme
MPHVELRPFTKDDRQAFIREELANYADEQVREAGWPREEALERARNELGPALEGELAEAETRGHHLWTAIGRSGRSVGWLWVTPLKAEAPQAAFLYQITVAERARRKGYGRAMLAAVEELLARRGIDELRLNVSVANEPARHLYETAGYEQVGQEGRRCHLRKQIRGRPQRS